MRNVNSPLGLFGLVIAGASLVACGGGAEKAAAKTDSSAAAAAVAAPPPAVPQESFTLVAKDGSWDADVTPAGIVVHRKGKKDVTFDYKAPSVDGSITTFEITRTAPDTHTFGAKIAMVPCTDNQKKSYTHMAQIWVDQVAYSGCGAKK